MTSTGGDQSNDQSGDQLNQPVTTVSSTVGDQSSDHSVATISSTASDHSVTTIPSIGDDIEKIADMYQPNRSKSSINREREMSEIRRRSGDLDRTTSTQVRDIQRMSVLSTTEQTAAISKQRRESTTRLERRRTKRQQKQNRRSMISNEEDELIRNSSTETENDDEERFPPSENKLQRECSQIEHLQKNKCVYRFVTLVAAIDMLTWFFFLYVFATYVQYQVLSSPNLEWTLSKQMRSLAGNNKQLLQVTDVNKMWNWIDTTLVDELVVSKTNIFHQKHLHRTNRLNMQTINGNLQILENTINRLQGVVVAVALLFSSQVC